MAALKTRLPLTQRGGRYHRLCKPEWVDCSDTSYSKRHGGRWNPAGAFGALYLNATIEVAAANAREWHRHRAIKLFDLRPQRRPQLEAFRIRAQAFIDAVSHAGVTALGLPETYPHGVGWDRCQPIGKRAYDAGLPGVACRSAAEARPRSWLGEELAVFDAAAPTLKRVGGRKNFGDWYKDLVP